MTSNPHLLIPMSGQGTRFRNAGYADPKPLIPVSGRPMIERLLEKFPADWAKTFVLADNHRASPLEAFLKKIAPGSQLIYIPEHTEGPGRAIKAGLDKIAADQAVFVSYCDYGMVWDAREFERFAAQSACDACVISYRGFHAHYLTENKYAYSRLEGDRVVEVREKGSFTDARENEFASAGGYYFRSAKLLREAIDYQYAHDLKLNGEFYTSLTVEALLRANPMANVRVFEIPYFFQWGTPEDLKTFEYWERTYAALLAHGPTTCDQLLMPMAGLGSRFAPYTKTPKPFLKVWEKPMFRAALATLPQAKSTVVVALEASREFVDPHLPAPGKAVYLKKTPPGQALSVEAGLSALKPDQEIVISSCDHGIALDPKIWRDFKRDAAAAIFTVRGFPGCDRSPNSFAYVAAAGDEVTSVSVKTPLSAKPSEDQLLIGTFWFKNRDVLKRAIDLLKAEGTKVNNEFYLDSVFNLLIQAKEKVRVIPVDGYINWGDPNSLAEALYWDEVFRARKPETRGRFSGAF